MRGPSLRPEMIERILRFEKVRVPWSVISEVTGVDYATVQRLVTRVRRGEFRFIQARSHGYDPEIAERRARGESHSRIAEAMGLCKSTVTKRVAAGLPGAPAAERAGRRHGTPRHRRARPEAT